MSNFKVVLPITTEEWQRDMNIAYNRALDDFEEKMNAKIAETDLRDNGYYVENLVRITKNELKQESGVM